MHRINNGVMEIAVGDDGTGLRVTDLRRRATWLHDAERMTCVTTDSEHRLPMKALGARREGEALIVEMTVPDGLVRYTWRLLPDGVEVALAVTSNTVTAVPLPGSFQPEGERAQILMPVWQGVLFRGDGEEWGRPCTGAR